MEVNFNRQTIISFPDNPDIPDINPASEESTSGIVDGSLLIDEVLFPDKFTIGMCNSNRFECELYNFPIIGKERIYVYQIVDETEGAEPVEVPLFTGFVDSCVRNRGRFEDSKSLTAYDALYKYANTDVSAWWEEVFDTATSVTLKELRDSLCEYLDIPYDDVTLPNDELLITQTQQLNIINFSSMMGYIMVLNGTNANVRRDGTLEFIVISDNAPIEIDSTYAQNTTEFDSYTVPAYGAVTITNSTENIVVTAGESSNCLYITDNLLLLDKDATVLKTVAENILNAIGSITYAPAQIDMIYSQLGIGVGDRVKIGNTIYLVCENTFSGPQFVDQHISSTGAEQLDESTTPYDASKKDMQDKIQASGMKYYRFQNQRALEFVASRQIISIRYTSTDASIIIFHGCVIIDVERIDDTQPAIVEIQYTINHVIVREYVPTETYFHDGRYTLNLLHFWEAAANQMETFIVTLIPTNCKITIGAFREEGYLEGMGLVGDATWDGVIELEENISLIPFSTTPSVVVDFEEELTVGTVTPHEIELEEYVGEIDFATTPSIVVPFEADLYVNKRFISELTWDEIEAYTWDEVDDEFIW